MPATAHNLRDLHQLHERAKSLRDRLTSGPKTIAARDLALLNRQTALEASKKALQDAKVQLKKKEHTVQSINAKIDDLKVKLNAVKKNEEYKAIQNQIALDNNAIEKLETAMLDEMVTLDDLSKRLAADDADVKAFAVELAALKVQIDAQSGGQRQQLTELETAIVDAEEIIPIDVRERYRRTVKQLGPDAMAAVEYDRKSKLASCTGCFVSVTTHAVTELINGHQMSFCKSCGRVLYLTLEEENLARQG